MNVYKDFIQQLRKLTFDEVYILLRDITPKLSEYVRLLTEVKFEDGSYHTFYGDVKRIIGSFLIYYNETVDEIIKEADQCSNDMTKDDLMGLVEQTIATHQANQVEFGNAFLPIKSQSEKVIYEEIERKYDVFMKKVFDFRANLEKIQKQDKVVEFAKMHFEIVSKKSSDMLRFTHTYLAVMLADCLNQTRTSLEEILLRMSNNLCKMREECEETVNSLLHQLYDKNKERLKVCRRDRKCSIDQTEVDRGVQLIRHKIETFENEFPLSRLEEEVSYWQGRLRGFNEVAANLVKLKTELDYVLKQETIYNSMKTTELPGAKRDCWENMGANFAERKVYLKDKLMEEARAMITFFACRGTDHIVYTDHTGQYYLDEFNHKVYVFDYGLRVYHLNCEGDFREVTENLYYFDKHGRYTNNDGERIYQCAPCTSNYKLDVSNLLTKVSKDCGHSVRTTPECGMEIKDRGSDAVLPDAQPVDIKNTLDSETVKYLWDSFGCILPDALCDVCTPHTNNPIHLLAHKLLLHKYKRTLKEQYEKKAEAEDFRANIFKERKEKAVAASAAWKAKQVSRRKPEESDDAPERAVYDAQIAQQHFINSLDFYNV